MEVRSNWEWTRWGKEDPLWAVATEPDRMIGTPAAWTDAEFYATGESDWEDFFYHWRQYGVLPDLCLEVGCGAGRITRHLCKQFRAVHAVDVSAGMIEYARRCIDSENVRFSLTDGATLPQATGSATAVFSTHVLQHIEPAEAGLQYFREFYRVLSAGGTIMVHLPLYDWPPGREISALLALNYRLADLARTIITRIRRQLRRRMMAGSAYRGQALYAFLSAIGFRDIEFRAFAISRNGQLHHCVLAKK